MSFKASDDQYFNVKLIDEFYMKIVNVIRTASITSYGSRSRPKKKKKQVVGWNYHVRSSHEIARLDYINWFNNGKPRFGTAFENMCKSRRLFKCKLKWCQDNEEQIKMNILAESRKDNNFVKFWKDTKKLNGKNSMPVSVENLESHSAIANLFARHFKVEPSTCVGDVREQESSVLPENSAQDVGKEVPTFSADDISATVLRMKRGKSPGFDCFSLEHILYAGSEICRVLSELFNVCLEYGHLPSELMRTVVVPVAKNKTGDLSKLANFRPISLGTIIGKILERLLQPALVREIKIDDAQFGFRPGLATDSAIFSLKHTIQYYVARETSVYACFLDLSRAFDLVNYDLLWKKLRNTNVNASIVNLLRYWYENQINNVKWGDALSSDYRLDCGVRQGGLTSPDLFNLYINGLIAELKSSRVGCHIGNLCINNLSYADDMVLLSPSVSGLRKLLNICVQYADSHGLKYNVQKTEIIIFRWGKGPENVPTVFLYEHPVQVVKRFKYLGHVLTEHLKDDEDMERERRALAVRCNMLARRFAKCNDQVKLTLFTTFCQNFYTCQLWSSYNKKSYSTLRIQYNNAFRILMRKPRFCSASSMFAEARIPDFYALLRSRIMSFWSRLRASKNVILRTIAECPDNQLFRYWLSVHQSMNNK